MRTIILFLLIMFGSSYGIAQPEAYRCPCSKIGIDEGLADSSRISCYLVPVERFYNQQSGGSFSLAVAVVAATTISEEPPLLYLHGGPGIATLGNLRSYLQSPTWALMRKKHDLVFFDYRGTGFSEPALCNDLADSMQAFMGTDPQPEDVSARQVALYQRCRESLLAANINLESFSSFQLAADAEALRKILQLKKWNVYGVSYGTTIALNILRSFPGAINAMILDSPFPPNAPWVDFVRPFDTCFSVLEHRLQSNQATAGQFKDLRTQFASAVNRLNKKPARLSPPGVQDTSLRYSYTGDHFAWSVWSAMLRPSSIPFVPLFIREVANGNDAVLQPWSAAFSSPGAHGKFSETQSNAILCFEGKPQQPGDSRDSLLKYYPEFASFNSGFNEPVCNVWRPDNPSATVFDPVVSDIPVLILAGEYDPVCPPFFGEITAKTLSGSTLLVVSAASHAAIHVDDCVRTTAYRFLSSPRKKLRAECISTRRGIEFVHADLLTALKNYNINGTIKK